VTAEDVGFPLAMQAARLLRQTTGRQDEEVALITSAPPERLNAQSWLCLNRQGWGIESGLHQRLDVSYNDDRCRVQSDKGMLILGIYRRVANSLFMEWAQRQPRPDHVTTTDFQTLMAEEHRAKALRSVLAKRPSLKKLS
jgi:predicted transposase YbfD/YdcC